MNIERQPLVALGELVARRASPEAAAWFKAQLAEPTAANVVSAFAGAGRRLGKAPVPEAEPLSLRNRPLEDVGRAALLLAALDAMPPDGHQALVADLFWRGSDKEKAGVLRALPLLPEPKRFVDIGVEAVRNSSANVFEGITCENPYPAEFFTDAQFNQMVLKAIFNEVSVARIEGLARRATPELQRMVEGYGSERRAAGRPVPNDIALVSDLIRSKQ